MARDEPHRQPEVMTAAPATQGHDSRYCGAKKRQGDGACTRPAGWGTGHPGAGSCKLHGGSTPTVAKGAKLALLDRQARELFGAALPEAVPVDNPLAAYAEFAGRVMAWMRLMDSLLDGLRRASYEDLKGEQHAHAVVELYERAMDRANAVLSSYARLKIDERLAAIADAQKQAVIRAVNAALDEADIQGDERANATRAVVRHLRSV